MTDVRENEPVVERGALPNGRRGLASRGPSTLVRLVMRVLFVVIPLALMLGVSGTAHADEEEDELNKLSFYRLSSSMTALFSTAQEPDSDVSLEDDSWAEFMAQPANAGSMLGYADEDYNIIAGWLNSRMAQSSDSIGYETLVGSGNSGISGETGAQDFALFGATLNGLGLDSTSTGLSLGFFNALFGGIIFLLYTVSAAVDALWSILIQALIGLNPFQLFYDAISNPMFAEAMTGGEEPPEALEGLTTWIAGWYEVLEDLAWTVMVPLFIGVFLMSILLFKQFDKVSGLKKLFIRMLFLGLGLPLLGSMYTGMLNAMAEATDEGNSGSARVVLSTYVDFEGWAMDHRLRVPDGEGAFVEWDESQHAPSGRSQASVRTLALQINHQVLGLSAASLDEDESWGGAMDGSEAGFEETHYAQVASILGRYMSSAHVSASSFETESKATLPEVVQDCEEDDKCARSWFENYMGDPGDVVDADEPAVGDNPLLAVRDEGLTASGGSDARRFRTSGDVGACGLKLSTPNGNPMSCNLAPLAMYNYLNTDFGPTSYTAYSSGRSSSEATRSIHNSVSLVGTGTMSAVYWFNAVVLLGAFITIGIGYAVAMLIGNIRRSFQLITAIPFATLGAISGIAKVIVYSIALIMEVVVTLFLYKFVQEFLLSLPSIIETPFAAALNSTDDDETSAMVAFLVSGGFITMIVTLVTIILVILFTVMAMRLRKTLVKAVEEAATKLVEKLTDSKVTPPGGGGGGMSGKMPALSSGAASGAGAAMGNRMMGGGGGPKGGGPNAGGTNGGGPEGISTASGDSNETRVGGDVDTDGTLEGPGELTGGGDGDDDGSGAGLDPGDANGDAARETELGRRVEADGLSMPPGSADPDNPRVGDAGDPLEAGMKSVQESGEEYRKADAAKVGAVKDTAEAGVHAGVAVGRGMAGDAAGAAESGGKALEKGGSATAQNAQSKEHKERAGKSSLDNQNPNPNNVRRMNQGRQMQQTGRTVSNTAGLASGGTGGKPGGGGPKPTGGGPKPTGGSKPTGGTGGKSGGGPKPAGGRTGNPRKPRGGNNRKK